jgi:glutathione synthase/RimK-type ligase-like ATP-grasp enzyme
VWDDPKINWAAAAGCVVRSTWDYQLRRADFLRWADEVDAQILLMNEATVLRWNTHKAYLAALADWAVPTVPTMIVREGDGSAAAAALAGGTSPEVIVKPAIGASASGVGRFARSSEAALTEIVRLSDTGDVLVQPFLEMVRSIGETSVMVIDGKVTHAVRKVPADGDFRVQDHLGGIIRSIEPEPREVQLALDAVAAAQHHLDVDLLYARVDLLPTADGPLLAELELAEPDLSWWAHPRAADRMADAILRRITRPTTA